MLTFAVIIYATLFPDPMFPDDSSRIPGLDKLIHAVMFGGFAGALAFDYARKRPRHRPEPFQMGVFCLLSLFAGGCIEVLQEVMSIGRSGDWLDLVADGVGVVVAFFAAPPAVAAVLKISR